MRLVHTSLRIFPSSVAESFPVRVKTSQGRKSRAAQIVPQTFLCDSPPPHPPHHRWSNFLPFPNTHTAPSVVAGARRQVSRQIIGDDLGSGGRSKTQPRPASRSSRLSSDAGELSSVQRDKAGIQIPSEANASTTRALGPKQQGSRARIKANISWFWIHRVKVAPLIVSLIKELTGELIWYPGFAIYLGLINWERGRGRGSSFRPGNSSVMTYNAATFHRTIVTAHCKKGKQERNQSPQSVIITVAVVS